MCVGCRLVWRGLRRCGVMSWFVVGCGGVCLGGCHCVAVIGAVSCCGVPGKAVTCVA